MAAGVAGRHEGQHRPRCGSKNRSAIRSTAPPGHRIKYLKVDADTGEDVTSNETMKCKKVDTDTYIEIAKDEPENIALSPSLGSG